jgi:glycosyltransferase involved in cell wall biosynthesis
MVTTGSQDKSGLRIGFFVPWITKSRGGTENVGHMMANAMRQRGHDVVIFTFDDNKGASLWPLATGIEIVHLAEAANPANDGQMALEVGARNLDLLVGLHMNRTFSRYVRCAHKVKLPIVISEHIDPRFSDWMDTFSPEERTITFSGATLIHLLEDSFRETLAEGLQDRIRVIPNTIREPGPLPGTFKNGKKKTILSVSRLVPRKNVGTTLAAFSRLAAEFRDWSLEIVGDGPERKKLARQAASLGIGNRVDFRREMSDPYPAYANADVFVIPSFFEGFPMTVCEAMAHGLPVVGFGTCNGVKVQVIPGETGALADGVDPAASLAAALRPILKDAEMRERMGKASRSRYENNFSNEVIFRAWEELFLEAVSVGYKPVSLTQDQILSYRLAEMVGGQPDITLPTRKSY